MYGYILRNHLYGTDADLKNLTLEQLRPVALSYLKHKRIPHVLGTEQEAIRLAERYGANVEQARRAALLHDCTKKLEMPEQLALCRKYGIELDALEQKALKLLHAKTGAAIARAIYGGGRRGVPRHLVAHHGARGHDTAGEDHLSCGLHRALPGFPRSGHASPLRAMRTWTRGC